MNQLKFRRGCALAVSMCMLLTGCTLGGQSSEQQEAPAPALSMAEAPQSTASPVEQTGYGYLAEEQTLSETAIFARLCLIGEKPWLVEQAEDGSVTLRDLEGNQAVSAASVTGAVLGACGSEHAIWLCLEQDGALLLQQLDEQGDPGSSLTLPESGVYPVDLAMDGNGYFYVLTSEQVLVYSESGKNISSLKLSGGSVGMRLAALAGGQVVLTSSENGKGNAVRLLTTESIGKDLTDDSSRFLSYGGYQALLSGGGNLYAMDPETNQMEVLLNWVDSGVDPGILADCIGGSQERIWYLTSSEAGMVLGVLQRTDASELPTRETLNVGVGGSVDAALTARITALAVDYNQSQEENRIHLVDYSLYGDGDSRLAADAGDLDLIVGDAAVMDASGLSDLDSLYDEEVGADTLLSGVQNAVKADRMPLSFYIETLVGTADNVGQKQGWTPQEFADTVAAHTDLAVLKMCNSYDALSVLLEGYTGAAEGIAPLLEACSTIPVDDQELYALAANAAADDETACVKNGTLLLAQAQLKDFMDLRELSAKVGDGLVYKGYPAESGNGTLLHFTAYLGIPEGSRHQAAAWEFLKSVVTGSSDFLGAQGLGFPVLEQDFMDMAQAATQKISFQNEAGETVEQDPVIWVDGEAQTAAPFTDSEIQSLVEWIGGVSGAYGCSQNRLETGTQALKLVIEEGAAAKDAAKEIAE